MLGNRKQTEVCKWKSIIEVVGPERCTLCKQLEETFSEDEKWKILMAVFSTRAPATLRKHAGAMNTYMRWCQVTGYDPSPIIEQKTWNYCSFLKGACAPATRADSFIKAARVTIQLLSMKASSWDTGSDRIEGTIVQCLDTKRVLQHAVPMTVRQVEIIEETIFDTSAPAGKRIVAGFARFCVGARLRHSDATRVTAEPTIDDSRPSTSHPGSEE